MVHVPYKGGAPAVVDLVAGNVQLGFHVIATVMPHMKSGRLVPLGVGTKKRAAPVPDVPAIAETVPGFEYTIWYAIFAPAKTPPALVEKISADIQRALKEPDVAQPFAAQGMDPNPTSPRELAAYIREDTARWAKIVRERHLKGMRRRGSPSKAHLCRADVRAEDEREAEKHDPERADAFRTGVGASSLKPCA